MSASKQKKSRQDQRAAYMTERQRQEAQEAKKLKVYTTTFWIVLALCLCIVLSTVLSNPVKNVLFKNDSAVTVGEHTLNSVWLNYFYVDAAQSFYDEYKYYANLLGIDFSKPLNRQTYGGQTLSDVILANAQSSIKSVYAVYDLAVSEGYELPEDEIKEIDDDLAMLPLYAAYSGYSDSEAYLRAIYGNGAEVESFREYSIVKATANAYYNEYVDSLDYTNEDIRNYESADDNAKYNDFTSLTYASYYLPYTSWAPTKDDDGKEISYTEDELQAARDSAKAAAESLAAGKYDDLDAFDKAIAALEINKDKTTGITCTRSEDTIYTSANKFLREWLVKGDHEEGDMAVLPRTETDDDDVETILGYYVVRFGSLNENKFALKNVRHILIGFEGGTYNSTTGATTYTDAEKKAALEKAEKLYNEWKAGDATEESFIALVEKNSTDTGSNENGGLYEDVYPGQMVEKFEEFCYDESRKPGDHAIVESSYGYHIMYFVGDSELTYRDYLIKTKLIEEHLEKWMDDLLDAQAYKLLSDRHVRSNLIVANS